MTIIFSSDMNINVKNITEVSQRYLQILSNFDSYQHIKQYPTRNAKKIMDHICTNISSKVMYAHTQFKKVKLTRPAALWMKYHIIELHKNETI